MTDLTTRIRVTHSDRTIHAEYGGGAYITVRFGPSLVGSEVINVWSHEAGKPEIDNTPGDVVRAVVRWIEVQDEEWPEWFEGYVENARGRRER